MIFTILACIYITLVCRVWGLLTLSLLDKKYSFTASTLPFTIVCTIGFAAITVFAAILSLVMPLGGWQVQLYIFTPVLLFIIRKRQILLLKGMLQWFINLHRGLLFLLLSCLLMMIIISTWTINHPDTLYYHAQTIRWIEQYKAIPGIVHLHTRYGLQGLWFVACAVFSFKFLGTGALTYINFTIIAWYLFFLIANLNKSLQPVANPVQFILFLCLLAISLFDYTQARLAASSTSPDFVAAIFIWLIFYLFIYKDAEGNRFVNWPLLILLSFFAITLKLSALPVLIIAFVAFYQLLLQKEIKQLIFSGLFVIIILFPFITRNIISSGYVIFPSTFPDIVNVDWKVSKELTVLEKDYITGYARGFTNGTEKEVQLRLQEPVAEWLPGWWKQLSVTNKFLLLIVALSFILAIARIKQLLRTEWRVKLLLLCEIAGICFWFIQAPDPRFGLGFLILFPATVIYNLIPFEKIRMPVSFKRIATSSVMFILFAVLGYTAYRCRYFFSTHQLVYPIGIIDPVFTTYTCNTVTIYIPEKGSACGDLPVPCAYDSCRFFQPRGRTIEDGFKAR